MKLKHLGIVSGLSLLGLIGTLAPLIQHANTYRVNPASLKSNEDVERHVTGTATIHRDSVPNHRDSHLDMPDVTFKSDAFFTHFDKNNDFEIDVTVTVPIFVIYDIFHVKSTYFGAYISGVEPYSRHFNVLSHDKSSGNIFWKYFEFNDIQWRDYQNNVMDDTGPAYDFVCQNITSAYFASYNSQNTSYWDVFNFYILNQKKGQDFQFKATLKYTKNTQKYAFIPKKDALKDVYFCFHDCFNTNIVIDNCGWDYWGPNYVPYVTKMDIHFPTNVNQTAFDPAKLITIDEANSWAVKNEKTLKWDAKTYFKYDWEYVRDALLLWHTNYLETTTISSDWKDDRNWKGTPLEVYFEALVKDDGGQEKINMLNKAIKDGKLIWTQYGNDDLYEHTIFDTKDVYLSANGESYTTLYDDEFHDLSLFLETHWKDGFTDFLNAINALKEMDWHRQAINYYNIDANELCSDFGSTLLEYFKELENNIKRSELTIYHFKTNSQQTEEKKVEFDYFYNQKPFIDLDEVDDYKNCNFQIRGVFFDGSDKSKLVPGFEYETYKIDNVDRNLALLGLSADGKNEKEQKIKMTFCTTDPNKEKYDPTHYNWKHFSPQNIEGINAIETIADNGLKPKSLQYPSENAEYWKEHDDQWQALNNYIFSLDPDKVLKYWNQGKIEPQDYGFPTGEFIFDHTCIANIRDDFANLIKWSDIVEKDGGFTLIKDEENGDIKAQIKIINDPKEHIIDLPIFAKPVIFNKIDRTDKVDIPKDVTIDEDYIRDNLIQYSDSKENSNKWLFKTNLTINQFSDAIKQLGVFVYDWDANNQRLNVSVSLPEKIYQVDRTNMPEVKPINFKASNDAIDHHDQKISANSLKYIIPIAIVLMAILIVTPIIIVRKRKAKTDVSSWDKR